MVPGWLVSEFGSQRMVGIRWVPPLAQVASEHRGCGETMQLWC